MKTTLIVVALQFLGLFVDPGLVQHTSLLTVVGAAHHECAKNKGGWEGHLTSGS